MLFSNATPDGKKKPLRKRRGFYHKKYFRLDRLDQNLKE